MQLKASRWLPVGACAIALFVAASPASAAVVQCGDVITSSTTLQNDLVGCATPSALVVTGTNIKLNLNGHELMGTGANTGILVSSSSSGVTVSNGAVKQFETGVDIEAPDAVVTALGVENNTGPGLVTRADRSSVTQSVFDRNGVGIQIGEPRTPKQPAVNDANVRANTIMRSVRQGILVLFSSQARLVQNTIGQNAEGIRGSNAFTAVVDRNYVADNDGMGIGGQLWDGTKFTANKSLRNTGTGFLLLDSYVDVLGNTSSNNGGDGFNYYENGGSPASTRFGDNRAIENAGWGFHLNINTTDLGGNVARRNGLGDIGFFHP